MRLIALSLLLSLAAQAAPAAERIVFIRHGEKPPAGLGQLDCRGLNRALKLPAYFAREFGRPDAIFAPSPAASKKDDGVVYDYVRPLATIEPTAIAFDLPVDASLAFNDADGLAKALETTAGKLVVVAWEHHLIDDVARKLLAAHGGDPEAVPKWKGDDFDGVYVVTLAEGAPARFERRTQGLDGQPESCPN